MAQFARTESDTTTGHWNSSQEDTLWEAIDEVTPTDTNYISVQSWEDDMCRMELSAVTDPEVSTGHIIRFRARSYGSGSPEKLSLDLYEGTTLIVAAFNNYNPGRDIFATADPYTLSAAEADSIGDYSNLNVRFTTDTIGPGDGLSVSWFELEVPDAPVVPRRVFVTHIN